MINIKCAQCKRKLLKYNKIGKGRILRCYKARIVKYYPVRNRENLQCECGQLIGVDQGKWIKMKPNAFEYSGRMSRK